jgi:hypothetical protein
MPAMAGTAAAGALTKIVFRDGNVASAATTDLPVPITAGSTYQVRTVVRGTTFQTYVNGTLVDTTTDSTYPTGRVGFRQDGDESASFGDLRVTAPDGQTLFSDDFNSSAGLRQLEGLTPPSPGSPSSARR